MIKVCQICFPTQNITIHINRQKDYIFHQIFFGILSITTEFSTFRLIFHGNQYEDEIYLLILHRFRDNINTNNA